jgi:ankyrin repeat protein
VLRLLADHPDLAGEHLPDDGGRTLLHVATDWPGHFPRVSDTIAALVAAGADPNAAFRGAHAETPLDAARRNNAGNLVGWLQNRGATTVIASSDDETA